MGLRGESRQTCALPLHKARLMAPEAAAGDSGCGCGKQGTQGTPLVRPEQLRQRLSHRAALPPVAAAPFVLALGDMLARHKETNITVLPKPQRAGERM